MPEIVNCPQCERKLKVPDTLLGKSVKCPTCGATFTAEVADQAPAAPPPPPPPRRPPVEEYEERPEEPAPRRSGPGRRPPERDYDDQGPDDYEEDRPRRRSRRSRGDLAPHRGTLILILGILGFFVAGMILGPIAWIMGNNDINEIRAGRMDPEGEGMTNAGRICGMVVTILNIVIFVGCCGCFLLGAIMENA